MKRFLAAVVLALGLSAAARAETVTSCNAVTTAGACDWVATAGFKYITMTLFAVNATTGAVDTTATSASTAILEYQTGPNSAPIQFPKAGDAPITNIGGGCDPMDTNCTKPARAWKLPPHTYRVRWVMQTIGSGRVTGTVSRDND